MFRYSIRGRCSNYAAASRHSVLATPGSRCLPRPSAASTRSFASNSGKRPRFSQRLGEAMRNTKIQWYQIPVGLGIGFLGLVQFYKVSAREQEKQREIQDAFDDGKPPKRRPRIRPDGPWCVIPQLLLSPGPISSSLTLTLTPMLIEIAGKSRSCRLCPSRPFLGSGADSMS